MLIDNHLELIKEISSLSLTSSCVYKDASKGMNGNQWLDLSSAYRRLQERDNLSLSLVNDERDIVSDSSPPSVSRVVSSENDFIHSEHYNLRSKQFQAVLVKKDHEQLSLHGLLAHLHHKAKTACRHT